VTDDEIKAAMMDHKRWRSIVSSWKNGHKASGAIMLRAQELHNAGAPCVHYRTGEIQESRQ